jgi:hypothetical protein
VECLTSMIPSPAFGTGPVATRLGRLDFELGVPTAETAAKLFDEMDFQRACQIYLWALPVVNSMQAKRYAQVVCGSTGSDLAVFEGYRYLCGTLTPNVITPYISGDLDLARNGPMVVEIPPGLLAGSAMDFWQRPLTDFGILGPDQGKGARYLFVGPGQEAGDTSDAFVLHSPTFGILFFFRALDTDRARARLVERGVRLYPWAERENPPPTPYLTPDPEKITAISAMPRGMAYWERLAEFIHCEPVEDRDRFFVAMLRPLGIEKGRPFRPDERQARILAEAAFAGEAMAKANDFHKRFAGTRYRPDAAWEYVIMADPAQDLENHSQLDERAAWFYEAIFLTQAMISQTPGFGQAYLGAYYDKNGRPFDGGRSYALHVPANPPAKQFWSLTLYDVDTRGLIRNEEQIADLNPRTPGLLTNADGSVDLYFAPVAPAGLENNWIPTVPGRAWFTWFRLYAPLEAYFDKTWPLPDIDELTE